MGLINLRTDLKSLKYGRDRKGGGDSGQPYVKKDIPSNTDELDNALKYGTGGPDMLLRGGLLTPLKIVDDVVRFGKFFTDLKTPRGLLFIVQQNLLSRLAVETEASYGVGYIGGSAPDNEKILRGGILKEGIYTPLSTFGQAAGNAFGLHLNKQGLDPTGLIPSFRIRKYESLFRTSDGEPAVIETNNNRLVKLYKQKITYTLDSGDTNDNILYRYGGGPGSILGIGNTRINLISLEQRTSAEAFKTRLNLNGDFTDVFGDEFNRATFYSIDNSYLTPNNNSVPQRYIGIKDFGSSTLSISRKYNRIANPDFFPNQKISSFKIKNNPSSSISSGTQLDRSLGTGKSIEADNYILTDEGINEDIIDFIITVIDPRLVGDNPQQVYCFPAYIESFDDGFTVDWKAEKFMGRGEDFYTYNGFSRDMSITFKTYARNPVAMAAMYNNLQKITSALTPSYSTQGFMRACFFRLTVGSYLNDNPVIITSFKINEIISPEINWQINDKFSMPYIFTIDMQFKPLYEALPSTTNPTFVPITTTNNINELAESYRKELIVIEQIPSTNNINELAKLPEVQDRKPLGSNSTVGSNLPPELINPNEPGVTPLVPFG